MKEENSELIKPPCRKQTLREEIVNSTLHFFGTVIAVIGCYLLIQHGNGNFFVSDLSISDEARNEIMTISGGNLVHEISNSTVDSDITEPSYGIFDTAREHKVCIASYTIFTIAMINTFLISTIYHSVPRKIEKIKKILQKIDHTAVFLLIAGTYTPFCLISMKGFLGWVYFSAEWFLAIFGSYLFFIQHKFFLRYEVYLYLMMGWLALLAAPKVYAILSRNSFYWLVGGGIVYTLGAIPYSMDHKTCYHSLWHIFAMGGSFCHWLSVLFIK